LIVGQITLKTAPQSAPVSSSNGTIRGTKWFERNDGPGLRRADLLERKHRLRRQGQL
jgi:hypothetical protein